MKDTYLFTPIYHLHEFTAEKDPLHNKLLQKKNIPLAWKTQYIFPPPPVWYERISFIIQNHYIITNINHYLFRAISLWFQKQNYWRIHSYFSAVLTIANDLSILSLKDYPQPSSIIIISSIQEISPLRKW